MSTDEFAAAHLEIAALAGSTDPVFVFDGSRHRIVWANAAALRLWRVKSLEALTQLGFDAALPAVRILTAIARNSAAEDGVSPVEGLVLPRAGGGLLRLDGQCRRLARDGMLVLVEASHDGQAQTVEAEVAAGPVEALESIPALGMLPGTLSVAEAEALSEIARQIRGGPEEDAGDHAPHANGAWEHASRGLVPLTDAMPAAGPPIDFFAKVSHEVRTPLNSIIGFAEIMKDERLGPIGNEKYKGYAADIFESAGHALSLINDLLDLSKIQAGGFDIAPVPLELNEVVHWSAGLMQPLAGKHAVSLVETLTGGLPRVIADERSLRQILLNLLSNAVKFTGASGRVGVATGLDPSGAVVLVVRDNGVGMSEAEIITAFEPFRQLDTAPRRIEGTGLGLPLTKALVEANGAHFALSSRRGAGTEIRVTFPRNRQAAAPISDPS